MKRFLSSCLFAAALLASNLVAQVVTLRGEVTNGRETGCYYCPGYDYVIKWIGTRLDPSVVNLAPYLDQQVEIVGNWNGSLTVPIVTVTSIRVVAESFSISGSNSIGTRMDFNAIAPQGDRAAHVLAFGRSFAPLYLPLVMSLDPALSSVLGFGPTNGNNEFKARLPIPADPSIVGVRVYGQALIVPQSGAPWYFTNPDSKLITL